MNWKPEDIDLVGFISEGLQALRVGSGRMMSAMGSDATDLLECRRLRQTMMADPTASDSRRVLAGAYRIIDGLFAAPASLEMLRTTCSLLRTTHYSSARHKILARLFWYPGDRNVYSYIHSTYSP